MCVASGVSRTVHAGRSRGCSYATSSATHRILSSIALKTRPAGEIMANPMLGPEQTILSLNVHRPLSVP